MWRAYRRPSLAARLRPGPAGVSPPGVRLGSESLFAFGRNGCSASLGIGVRLQSERPLGFRRNLQLTGMSRGSDWDDRFNANIDKQLEAAHDGDSAVTEEDRQEAVD